MRYISLILFFLFACQQQTKKSVLPPEITLENWVNDRAGIFSKKEAEKLREICQKLSNESGPQIVILTVNAIPKGYTLESYSLKIASANQIGRYAYDDGVLMLIALHDRKLRLELGKGTNKVISDSLAKQVIDQLIVPDYKEGKFFQGTQKGLIFLDSILRKNMHLLEKYRNTHIF